MIKSVSYKRHRFPPEIIAHAVWLYFRFPLSLRLVEEMLLERGILVSYETVRRWALKFGSDYARRLRRKRPNRRDIWHLDAMDNLNHILNWKLKRSSHTFPGKDGRTCINEAAIVAAGFPYRPVRSVQDMPECFSRPICALAMQLNDEAEDAERQLLLPFVDRLACADTPEVEREREVYIAARLRWLQSFQEHLAILEGALAIGRHADTPLEEVKTRLEDMQHRATSPTSEDEHPLLGKMHTWLAAVF